MSEHEALLRVASLEFAYAARQWSLVIESLAVYPGERMAICGANGSGKSTLLKLLNGRLTPRRGEVHLAGWPLAQYSNVERAQTIALVAAEINLQLPFRVVDLVRMGRYPHLTLWQRFGPHDRQAVERALQATGLTRLAERNFNSLSSGERQLTMIARALAQEPCILLLDEPTAHLDIKHRQAILDLLDKLKGEQPRLAVMLVSHDLKLAHQHCNRLLLMKAGRIIADGQASQTLSRALLREAFDCDSELW